GCEQAPEPLHTSSVQRFESSAHAWPEGSFSHAAEQQSPSVLLPSSHSSPASVVPLPHRRGSTQLPSATPLSAMSQYAPVSSAVSSKRHARQALVTCTQSENGTPAHAPGKAVSRFTPGQTFGSVLLSLRRAFAILPLMSAVMSSMQSARVAWEETMPVLRPFFLHDSNARSSACTTFSYS